MTTVVATVIDAVLTALGASPAVATQIDRVRLRPIQQGTTQALVVAPERMQPSDSATLNPYAPVSQAVQFRVECYARATPGQTPDVAVDSLMEAVHARLFTAPVLSGACRSLQLQGADFDFDVDAEKTACVTLSFSATCTTSGPTSITP